MKKNVAAALAGALSLSLAAGVLPLIKPPATWPLRKLLKLPKVLAARLPKPVKVLAAQP